MLMIFFEVALDKRGIYRSRSDTVGPDFGRVIDCKLPRHRHHCSFRTAVREASLHADKSSYGTDVDNATVRRPDEWQTKLCNKVQTTHVHPKDTIEVGGFRLLYSADETYSGIIDEDVQPVDSFNSPANGGFVGDVEDAIRGAGQFGGETLGARFVDINDDDSRARRRQHSRRLFADSACSAGHERRSSVNSKRFIHRVNSNSAA